MVHASTIQFSTYVLTFEIELRMEMRAHFNHLKYQRHQRGVCTMQVKCLYYN